MIGVCCCLITELLVAAKTLRQCLPVGTNIEKLRSQALAGAAAESVSWVSANDIMSAILWLTR